MLRGLWRRGSVLEGRVQVRGGVRRPHALPSRVRSARGGGFFSGFVLLRATAPPGMIRPGILARQPCTGAAAAPSTHPSWTHEDTSVHARGKRPVPRGEAHSAYNSGGDEAPFTSGVCLITRRQTWLLQRPSSLTHPLPSGAWWRAAIKGRGVLIIRGEAADSSHSPPQATSPSSGRRPRRSATFLNQAPAVGVGGAGIPLRATLPLAPRRNRDRETGLV